MPDPFIGEIRMFAGNFAPRNWALCDGQLLPISQYSALFSLLGTHYGGDGRSTFGLPDLRGRAPMHAGQGPGLTPRSVGQKGGEETVTLTEAQIPAHRHLVHVRNDSGNSPEPANRVPAIESKTDADYGDLPSPPADSFDASCVSMTGGGQAHDNMAPFQCINFIIAIQGLYPSRS
ncbi:MAG: tail fiber protein [Pseudomonadota bacterium]